MITYDRLLAIRPGHRPIGWDAWGRPWAFMNIAVEDLPEDMDTWRHLLGDGNTITAVLVHYDPEPYYFTRARALLVAATEHARPRRDHSPTWEGWMDPR